MHTFKIEIENEDVLDRVLWFLKSLNSKGVRVTEVDDDFLIDTQHCLDLLDEEKQGKNDSFKQVTSYELFNEIGI